MKKYFLRNTSLLWFFKAFKNIVLKVIQMIFNQYYNFVSYVNHNKGKT